MYLSEHSLVRKYPTLIKLIKRRIRYVKELRYIEIGGGPGKFFDNGKFVSNGSSLLVEELLEKEKCNYSICVVDKDRRNCESLKSYLGDYSQVLHADYRNIDFRKFIGSKENGFIFIDINGYVDWKHILEISKIRNCDIFVQICDGIHRSYETVPICRYLKNIPRDYKYITTPMKMGKGPTWFFMLLTDQPLLMDQFDDCNVEFVNTNSQDGKNLLRYAEKGKDAYVMVKCTRSVVKKMLKDARKGMNRGELAVKYGVCNCTVSDIFHREGLMFTKRGEGGLVPYTPRGKKGEDWKIAPASPTVSKKKTLGEKLDDLLAKKNAIQKEIDDLIEQIV